MQYRQHLLQQHSVVAFKGLKDVMVTAQGPKAVYCCIAVAAAALTADGQCVGCVVGCVSLQACSKICASNMVQPTSEFVTAMLHLI